MPPTKRIRDITYRYGTGRRIRRNKSTGNVVDITTGSASLSGRQITVSEGHPFTHKFEGKDQGGDFSTSREYYGEDGVNDFELFPKLTLKTASNYPGNTLYEYTGPVFPFDPATFGSRFPPSMGSSRDELMAAGTTAISRCKPGQPVAQLSVALAELISEGLPGLMGSSIWRERAISARSIANENLAWQFGWLPLFSDIRSVANALRHQDRYLAQYERDAGRLVRRQYEFPEEVSVTETVLGTGTAFAPKGTHAGAVNDNMSILQTFAQCALNRTHEVRKKRWFSGAFVYHLPSGYYSRNKMIECAAKAKILLGLELTPETIWNLIPWSWAADWVTNYGDVLSNVSDFASDDLVMPYGYIMEETTSTYTYTLSGHGLVDHPGPVTMRLSRTTKQRYGATPFGFGLEWGSFTPRQLSILASLGISRAR